MKFKSDIEVQAGLKDSSGAIGTSGQLLSSTSSGVSWTSLNGFVPYVGATANVNLGTYTLLAAKGVFSSSGSGNTVEIGHSSGSGIALNITKGGNGEGLYINKTSGSGNAVTIIGNASISADSTINGVSIGIGSGNVSGNTRVGLNALNDNTTGTDISAFGAESLRSNTTGIANAANGSDSLRSNTTGSYNTAAGSDSLRNNTTGSYSTGIGEGALRYSVTGSYNSALGVDAGSLTSGGLTTLTINNSVFIGAGTRALNQSGDTNQIVIGHNAVGLGSNTVTLGNTSITTTRLRGAVLGGFFVKDGGTQDQYLKADGSVSTAMNSRVEVNFTATSGQTTFTTTYEVGQIDVYYNGSKLNPNEFTATNGTTVVLAQAATLNAQISIVKYVAALSTTAIRNETTFTATSGQTTFSVNYTVGQLDVFYNGSKLNVSEFTATNGTSVVLGFACVAGESVVFVSYVNQVSGASGTANRVAKFTGAATLGDSQIFDNGSNLGIGSAPSAWSGFSALQLQNGSFFSDPTSLRSIMNGYYNGSAWIYSTTNAATRYEQLNGIHRWLNAPTGTVGNSITFTQAMTLNGNGNLLIGTTTDSGYRLNVSGGNDYSQLRIDHNSHAAFLIESTTAVRQCLTIFKSPTRTWAIGLQGNGDFTIRDDSAAATRITITTGGNTGIRTSDPRANLQVEGGTGININNLGEVMPNLWRDGGDGGLLIRTYNSFFNTFTSIAKINPSNGAYSALSDIRLKENILDSESAIEKISEIKVRKFDWKNTGEKEDYGFIAQELNEVLPQYVYQGNEDTSWGVSKAELVPLLVKAIQEQQAQIKELQDEIISLKNK